MNNAILKAVEVKNPDDIRRIQETVPFLNRFSPIEVQLIWEWFSRDLCAGYLNVHEETLKHFKEWCE